MGMVVALKSAEVQALSEAARRLPSAGLRELAFCARRLRREVEERWEELPSDSRQALEDLARSWGERSLPRGLCGKAQAFWEGLKLGFALARGKITREDLGEFLHEVSLLSRRVMDRLEEEDPAFQEALQKALAEESLALSKEELRALILDPEGA